MNITNLFMNKIYYIYEITNLINEKTYIGQHQTDKFSKLQLMKNPYIDGYYGSGVALQKAYIKYGKENFCKKIIEFVDNQNDLNLLEIKYINEGKIKGKCEYNIDKGGKSNYKKYSKSIKEYYSDEKNRIKASELTKLGMSKMTKEEKSRYTKQSAKTKLRWSDSRKQEYHNLLSIKISESYKIKKLNMTDEEKEIEHNNRSKVKLGKNNPMYGKPSSHRRKVYCEELNRIFESFKQIEDELNLNHSNVINCCKGKYKTCGGYHFSYYDEDNS